MFSIHSGILHPQLRQQTLHSFMATTRAGCQKISNMMDDRANGDTSTESPVVTCSSVLDVSLPRMDLTITFPIPFSRSKVPGVKTFIDDEDANKDKRCSRS